MEFGGIFSGVGGQSSGDSGELGRLPCWAALLPGLVAELPGRVVLPLVLLPAAGSETLDFSGSKKDRHFNLLK